MLCLLSNNAKLCSPPTVQLSTIELPTVHPDGMLFETAIIAHGARAYEDIARYSTMPEAVAGHARLCEQYGCTNHITP